MKHLNRYLKLFLLFSLVLSNCALSQPVSHRMSVQIRSPEKLTSAYGLVIHEDPLNTKALKPKVSTRKAVLKKVTNMLWRVTVLLEQKDFKPNSKLAVIARSISGRTIAGPVKWVSKAKMEVAADVKCKQAQDSSVLEKILTLDKKALTILVSIRDTKRRILAHELKQKLTSDVIFKLEALEQKFGFSYPEPISAKLPLYEIAYRIGVLNALLSHR